MNVQSLLNILKLKDMLKGKDIVIVGQQAWDVDIGSNCKDIALELTKDNRVLYVNAPLDRITKIRYSNDPKVKRRLKIIKRRTNELERVNESLWVLYPPTLIESINWIPVNSLFSLFNKANNNRFFRSISQAIVDLQMKDYVLFNDNDIFRSFYLKELLKPSLSIYYLRDYLVATKYWKRHGRILEPQLMAKNDVVFANSEYLTNYGLKHNPHSYYVGQGCDFTNVNKKENARRPKDLVNISGCIIGYVGALTVTRLDIDLIAAIADAYTDSYVVLVGPEDELFKRSRLHRYNNVLFLGRKEPDQLYQYINAFDVCINPQVLNAMTIGNYPRKVDEYLAMGKPVVATWTEAMKPFGDYVYLAKNNEAFISSIRAAIEYDSDDLRNDRINFALSHTWENSVKVMSNKIENTLKL